MAGLGDSELRLLCWRRIDVAGLELLELTRRADGVSVRSSLICVEDGPFRLEHEWVLTPDWRAISLRVRRSDANGGRSARLERDGEGWRVDGEWRPDLDGAEEPDLSVTPFCNTLVMRRVPAVEGGSMTVDVAYVDGADLSVARSRQRYDYRAPGLYRYIDLGLSAGFEADLSVDEDQLVMSYDGLFERVAR